MYLASQQHSPCMYLEPLTSEGMLIPEYYPDKYSSILKTLSPGLITPDSESPNYEEQKLNFLCALKR